MLETDDELSRMKHVMNNDVVVLTHVKMKLSQIEGKNTKMYMEAQSSAHKIKEVQIEFDSIRTLNSFLFPAESRRVQAQINATKS